MLQLIEDEGDPAASPLSRELVGRLCDALWPTEPPASAASALAQRAAAIPLAHRDA